MHAKVCIKNTKHTIMIRRICMWCVGQKETTSTEQRKKRKQWTKNTQRCGEREEKKIKLLKILNTQNKIHYHY